MKALSLSYIPFLIIDPGINILASFGKINFTAKISLIESIFGAILSVIFVIIFKLDLVGVACGSLFARFFFSLPLILIFMIKEMQISGSIFIRQFIIPTATSTFLFSLICFFSVKLFSLNDWSSFLLNVTLVGGAGLVLSGLIWMPNVVKKYLFLRP